MVHGAARLGGDLFLACPAHFRGRFNEPFPVSPVFVVVDDGDDDDDNSSVVGCLIAHLSVCLSPIPLTAVVVGAPQMTSQPVCSIFFCSPLLSGTWQTPACPFPDVVFPSLFGMPCVRNTKSMLYWEFYLHLVPRSYFDHRRRLSVFCDLILRIDISGLKKDLFVSDLTLWPAPVYFHT